MGDLATTFWGLIASERPSETLKDLKPTPCEGIWILESVKFLNVVSGLLGLWNAECSLRSPESSTNPESKSVLDSLTWSDRVMPGAFGIVEGLVTLLSQAV